MTFALASPTRDTFIRAWLAACAATVAVALVVAAMFGRTSTAAVADITPPSLATATAEEPWTPGVMTFSGERTPTQRTTPIATEDLNPDCYCIGFF